MNLPGFWRLETGGVETDTYNLAESCVLPPRLDDVLLALPLGSSASRLGYGDPDGTEALRSAVAALYPGARSEDVLITTGATEANFLALSTLCGAGDRVIVAAPTYQPLYEVPRSSGATVDFWWLRAEDRWHPDLAELRRLLRNPARLVIINFPNNPTGATGGRDFLEAAADLCRAHGALLYSDEVYRGLPLSSESGQPSVWEAAPRESVVIGSLSKTYGLPGLRVAWLVGPHAVRAGARRVRAYTSISPSVLSEELAVRVFGVGPALLRAQRTHARRNLAYVEAFMRQEQHGLSWVAPTEGAVGFVRYASKLPSSQFAHRLADEKGTLVVPGACFGQEHHFRLGFGGDTQTLQAGLGQLGAFIAALHGCQSSSANTRPPDVGA